VPIRPLYEDVRSAILGTRMLCVCEKVPAMPDAGSGFANRVVSVRWTKTFKGVEDKDRTENLLKELPGIFNWAIVGLQRLRANDKFTETESGEIDVERFKQGGNAFARFSNDCLAPTEGAHTTGPVLLAAFKSWCQQNDLATLGDRTSAAAVCTALVDDVHSDVVSHERRRDLALGTDASGKPKMGPHGVTGIALRPIEPAQGKLVLEQAA